jgi:putative peptide zinc metalloprotease protein
MPASVVAVLRRMDGRRDLQTILDAVDDAPRALSSVQDWLKLLDGFCVPRGIVTKLGAAPIPPPPVPHNGARYLLARIPLLRHNVVYAIASRLTWLFSLRIAAVTIAASAVAHLWFYGWGISAFGIRIEKLEGSQFLVFVVMAIAAAMVHEFGHAAALARFGCRRLEIGVGWYIWQPVLYTDVSEAWRLGRLERALVDIGGIYFHLFAQFALLALFVAAGWREALFAFLAVDAVLALSLNPFLRMDGYWLLADLWGFWSPAKQCRTLLRRMWNESRRSKSLPSASSQEWLLIAYVVATVAFFANVSVAIAKQVFGGILPSYPGAVVAFIEQLEHLSVRTLPALVRTTFGLALKTVVIVMCLTLVLRALRKVASSVISFARI